MQIPVKVKATGEIVDVTINVATAGNPLYTTSGGVTYLGDDIESAEPDWQQVRIQAAIAAMQTIADTLGSVDYNKELIVKHAVELADALIEELKKGGKDD